MITYIQSNLHGQASKHHGNTYKLVNAISEKYDIAMMDATKESIVDLQEYEVSGFTDSIKEIDLEKEAVILDEYGCKVYKTYFT